MYLTNRTLSQVTHFAGVAGVSTSPNTVQSRTESLNSDTVQYDPGPAPKQCQASPE